MALVHYVKFLFPGLLFPEEQTVRIDSRDAAIDAPEGCFAYLFFDREEVEQDGEKLLGAPKNISGRYYFGEVLTADDINRMPGNHDILLCNMVCNGWERVVRTRRGNFQPLEPGDVVLPAKVAA